MPSGMDMDMGPMVFTQWRAQMESGDVYQIQAMINA